MIQDGLKNGRTTSLHMPRQYKDVHTNPDSDCYMLQVTTLNFIFTPVVMGMTLTLVSVFDQHLFRLLCNSSCCCFLYSFAIQFLSLVAPLVMVLTLFTFAGRKKVPAWSDHMSVWSNLFLLWLPLVHDQRQHRHAPPPGSSALPGLTDPTREEKSWSWWNPSVAGSSTECEDHGMVASTVSLLTLHIGAL